MVVSLYIAYVLYFHKANNNGYCQTVWIFTNKQELFSRDMAQLQQLIMSFFLIRDVTFR